MTTEFTPFSAQVTFSQYIAYEIEHSILTQTEIANKMGLNNANIITMYKQQKAKIPLKRVPDISRILNLDPAKMMKMALYEYRPEDAEVIEKYMGKLYNQNEIGLINIIKKEVSDAGTSLPRFLNSNQKRKLEVFVDSLKD